MSMTIQKPGAVLCEGDPIATGGTASVVRALQLLDVFTCDEPVLGVSDIARRADVPTSTVHRLLSHLVKGDLVTKEGASYRLSDRLFELGNRVVRSRSNGLKDIAAPFLGELFSTTRLTTHLALLDGPEIIVVDKVVGLRSYPSRSVVGGRYPAVCTALGKAMLAFEPEAGIRSVIAAGMPRRTRHSLADPMLLLHQLAQTRGTRLAYDRQEASLGQTCVAAPIIRDGHAVAAVSLSGPADSFDVASHGSLLVRITAQLARKWG
jgi:DNA-binding IclR family transcriptional regulator